ncbi:MAG: glycoside hydrolase family 3 N-terminal domain-containing protein [Clostridiaceae bacterium]|nr:glycoside hydrolase family 3 N-terminal domain-containing protein [Clostridiaceae bacterium]
MPYIYQDAVYTPEERVADLLPRMTLDEKLQQMRLFCNPGAFFPEYQFSEEKLLPHLSRCGAIYCTDSPPAQFINAMQDYFLHKTRLGIPVAVHSESLHGAMHRDATVFPQALGLGATRNPDLITEMADIIGMEVHAAGVRQTYAPNLDLSRDPRWGRVEENYGEDPYLTSRLGVAYIKALQSHGIAASPKHYVAHGTPESGVNIGPVHAGERELRETLAVPFEKAFTEAGALSVMPAYSELDGVPVHASYFLMTKLLREEFGFQGHAVSDFGAISMLRGVHHVAEDAKTAGLMALRAGIDVEAPAPFGFADCLKQAVESGEVPMALIDQAVSRVLYVKFKTGLFEDPYVPLDAAARMHTPKAIDCARRVACETAVLLKNDGLLPLPSAPGKVAVIGPNAAYTQLGDYTLHECALRGVSVKQAFEERLRVENVLYSRGSHIAFENPALLAEAVEKAKAADVAVVVLGDNSSYYHEKWGDDDTGRPPVVTCGEGYDITDLDLPAAQERLLEAVYATGTPVVLVLMSGRPHSIVWAKAHIPAILEAWYPGEQGGYAIADLLFGDVNPSGKLPISIPQSVGHIPCYYNRKVSAFNIYKLPGTSEVPGRDYVFSSPEPLYPFGYGLSYTTFSYANLTVTPDTVTPSGTVTVTVDVTNTGGRAGKETVELYLRDRVCRITPFVRRLRGFTKLTLSPGETKTAVFTLSFEDFAFINEQMLREVEPGVFDVEIAALKDSFTVIHG